MKLIVLTRRGGANGLLTEIPFQFHITVVAFQLRVAVPRRVSFSPQRTSQSATSSVFEVGLGTTVPFPHGVDVCPRTSNNNWPDTRRRVNRMAAAPAAMPHRMGRPGEGRGEVNLRRGADEGGGGGG